MNTEQLKQINTHLALIEAELGRIRVAIREASVPLPDGIIGNSSDSPYVKSDTPDLNHYMPKVGEVVEVSTYGKSWYRKIFLDYQKDKTEPFNCVTNSHKKTEVNNYRKGIEYSTTTWRYCRRLNGEIIEFGCDAKQPERNEAEQTNPYAVDWTNAPDWADAHAFDEDGKGYWYGANSNVYKKEWGYDYECSNFTILAGLDWKLSKTFRPR